MKEIEDVAVAIVNAFEEGYFDEGKRDLFNAIFSRYLSDVDPYEEMDLYEAIVKLGRSRREEFTRMISELRSRSLISGE